MQETDSLFRLVELLPRPMVDLLTAKTRLEFNDAFSRVMESAIKSIERDCKELGKLGEDALSSEIMRSINGTNILVVTREEFSNGRVDLTFHARLCRPERTVLGESKLYKSYDWHEQGLTQLLGRYLTGREERALLLVFFRTEGIKHLMEQLREKLNQRRPCKQVGPCIDHGVQWSFVSKHSHSSGEDVEVWQVGCNLAASQSNPARQEGSSNSND